MGSLHPAGKCFQGLPWPISAWLSPPLQPNLSFHAAHILKDISSIQFRCKHWFFGCCHKSAIGGGDLSSDLCNHHLQSAPAIWKEQQILAGLCQNPADNHKPFCPCCSFKLVIKVLKVLQSHLHQTPNKVVFFSASTCLEPEY